MKDRKANLHYSPLDVSECTADQKEKILLLAAETRRFEIERFWQRSLFFWGFITAALVAYASQKEHQPQTIAACYGFLCSVAWSLQNRGSKYWHESWEQKVEAVQRDILGTDLFSNKEPVKRQGWLEAKRYSSSKLTTALSDLTALVWLALLYFPLDIDATASPDFVKLIALAATAAATLFLFLGTKSKP